MLSATFIVILSSYEYSTQHIFPNINYYKKFLYQMEFT